MHVGGYHKTKINHWHWKVLKTMGRNSERMREILWRVSQVNTMNDEVVWQFFPFLKRIPIFHLQRTIRSIFTENLFKQSMPNLFPITRDTQFLILTNSHTYLGEITQGNHSIFNFTYYRFFSLSYATLTI